jgi:hypothetical protein
MAIPKSALMFFLVTSAIAGVSAWAMKLSGVIQMGCGSNPALCAALERLYDVLAYGSLSLVLFLVVFGLVLEKW